MDDDRKKIRALLLDQWQYKEKQVDGIVEKILKMDAAILDAFTSWMDSGDLPDAPRIHGCTPRLLHASYPLKPPAAFLLLDWIRREPREALAALKEDYGHLPGEPGKIKS